jgi:hypothetical protein
VDYDYKCTRDGQGERVMAAVFIAIAVAILTFAGGMAGLYVRGLLPEEHSADKSAAMIGSVMGLVTLLLALVLGTIVGSAYFFSATQQSELQALSANSLLLDRALAQYGPETKPVRDRMKENLERNYQLFWKSRDVDPERLTAANALNGLQPMADYLASLDPTAPAQKAALAAANAHLGVMVQTRLAMSLQLANPFSKPLLIVVVFWSFFLFCGYGLLSRMTGTTVGALAFGALAVASAIFLILELSEPYTGLFRISPAALQETIAAIDK